VQRDRSPSVRDILALGKSPTVWRVGRDHVLAGYPVPSRYDWPDPWAGPIAWQVLDRRGEVVGQWAQRAHHEFVPAGRFFVGLRARFGRTTEEYGDASKAILVRRARPERLRLVAGQRDKRTADVRADGGWLIDPTRLTITREALPLCLRGSSRLDSHGRIWCLNRAKDEVLWSDNGKVWQRHMLSTSYFEWCDGGTTGADLEILDDVVTIGLQRADFSVDRGKTWWTAALPADRVGAGDPRGSSEQNCADVSVLPDNRLVVSYFGSIVASDASNTRFRAVTTPVGTYHVGVRKGTQEGVMLAATRSAYGDLLASYDSGRTWRPLRARDLARRLLARTS
jgi:hypothetical protein